MPINTRDSLQPIRVFLRLPMKFKIEGSLKLKIYNVSHSAHRANSVNRIIKATGISC